MIIDILIGVVGIVLFVWIIMTLSSPPKKHKKMTLHDQYKATSRALGGSGPPDLSHLKPNQEKQKRKK